MEKSANTLRMREINKNLVRTKLRQLRKATKQELALHTNLSIVTVGAILAELLASNEVFQGNMIPSNGGRPSLQYVYNEEFCHGIILYGYQKNNTNYIGLLVTNMVGTYVYQESLYLDHVKVDSFVPLIDRAIKQFPTVKIIGFGLPGEEVDGEITVNDYKDIIGDAFMPYYQNRYQLELLFINDINAASSGFYHYKSTARDTCNVGFYFPRIYPPGAGIVINGNLHTGKNSFAGEFFYMGNASDWLGMDYTKDAEVIPAIGDLIAIFSSVLAPEQFILYGDFWKPDTRENLAAYAARKLNNKFPVTIHLSDHFEEDFVLGITRAILEKLEQKIFASERN